MALFAMKSSSIYLHKLKWSNLLFNCTAITLYMEASANQSKRISMFWHKKARIWMKREVWISHEKDHGKLVPKREITESWSSLVLFSLFNFCYGSFHESPIATCVSVGTALISLSKVALIEADSQRRAARKSIQCKLQFHCPIIDHQSEIISWYLNW